MINQANEKTPVQQVHGLIPVVPVRDCPEWAEREAQQQHGSHRVIADDGVTVRCAVSATGYDHRRPTGDWVIEYLHNESDGVHSVRLFAAVRV